MVFYADLGSLDAKAQEVDRALEVFSDLDLAKGLGAVATALPGSRSVAAAERLSARWGEHKASGVEQSRQYVDALRDSSRAYGGADATGAGNLLGAGEALGSTGWGTG